MRVVGASVLGIIGGLLLSLGIYIYLMQAGNIDPSDKIGLAFPALGILLGIIAGVWGGRRRKGRAS
jgi:uncharacterized membrane protein YadS